MSKAKPDEKRMTAVASTSGDLIVLVADKDTKESIACLLEKRAYSLGIRRILFEIIVHPDRDPGCLTNPVAFLRPFIRRYHSAMIVFDHEGCGRESESREQLEQSVEEELARSGWSNSAAIVIEPELENWVWSPSPHVPTELGWDDEDVALTDWLTQNNWIVNEQQLKPQRPKEAMEAVLRKAKKPRSSAIYRNLAGKVSFARCADPAFIKFAATIRKWFPAS